MRSVPVVRREYRWLIAVPAWGGHYLSVLERATAPALEAAVCGLSGDVRVISHTDNPDRVRAALSGVAVETHKVPGTDRAFESLSEAHREVLQMAQPGDRVCLLTADLVMSAPMLTSCEAQFRRGKKLICCMGMRVCDDEEPPRTESGRELLSWGWGCRHPMTAESTWPDGHSYDVWRMYFEKGGEVACRLALPHPIALVKGRHPVKFAPTVDVNVMANFPMSEVHLITEPDEGALIEMSPMQKEFLLTDTMRRRLETCGPSLPSFNKISNSRHAFFFKKRIIVCGSGGDCGDGEVVGRMLE